MEVILLSVCAVMAVLIVALSLKIFSLRRAADELRTGLSRRLQTDTNTGLSISSFDRKMTALAKDLNEQLGILRREQLKYLNGDLELKNAVTAISHDLRTPLTAIFGYLDLLEKEEMSASARESLAVIHGRAEAMRELTEELFRYSVILTGDTYELRSPVILNDALEEALAAFYGALTARGITPDISMPAKKILRTLNPQALTRILANILGNAVKYSDGSLFVRLEEDGTISFQNPAPHLDELTVNRLFDRFYTVQTGENSTGLGLAIARTLAENQGGWVNAALKEGILTIQVHFPA